MTFKETIRLIWGASSQTVLAKRMAVSDRKVRLWIARDAVPVEAWNAVRVGLDEKIAQLRELKKEMK